MNESHPYKDDRLRDAFLRLDIQDTELKEALLRSLEALARESELLLKMDKLSEENGRLKQEVVRLRDLIYSKEDRNMSSRLRDALRE
jgi:hypothetical protein